MLSRWLIAAAIAKTWWVGYFLAFYAEEYSEDAAQLMQALILVGVISGLIQATIAIVKAKRARAADPTAVVDLALPRLMRAAAVMWFVIFAVEPGAQDFLYRDVTGVGEIPYAIPLERNPLD